MNARWPGKYSHAEHGTNAGYQMHKACGSMVCEPCRVARNKVCYDSVKRAAAKEKP